MLFGRTFPPTKLDPKEKPNKQYVKSFSEFNRKCNCLRQLPFLSYLLLSTFKTSTYLCSQQLTKLKNINYLDWKENRASHDSGKHMNFGEEC